MTSVFLELVQLPDGDFALRSSESDTDPLVKISFGRQAKAFLAEHDVEVAQAMIDSAIKVVGQIQQQLEKEAETAPPGPLH